MSLFDFSNVFDSSANSANAAPTQFGSTISDTASGILGSVENTLSGAASNFPSVVGNVVQSALTQAAQYTVMQARSNVSQKLTGLLNSVIPQSSNSILNSISNGIRNNVGNTAGQVLNGGVSQVLSAIGIGNGYNSPVRTSNPVVYNNGIGAAQGVVSAVNNGITDVNGIVSNSIDALTAFQYAHQTYVGASAVTTSNATSVSPYAMDLFAFAPKYNYLFIVDITFTSGFEALGQLNGQRSKFAMIIQEFDRPRIVYDMDEANYYNFRTKFAKRVTHENLRLKFLDDRQNASMNFITQYLIANHPLMGVSPQSSFMYEDAGMNWSTGENAIAYDAVNSASLRSFAGDQINAISEIKVYHVYDYGRSMNVYHFIRPKLVQVELDRWDMRGSSDNCTIEAEFAYDGLYIETGITIQSGEEQRIEALSNAGQYPMRPTQKSASSVALQNTTQPSYSITGDNQYGFTLPGGTAVGGSDSPAFDTASVGNNTFGFKV
jgi:hypothetical protein